MPNSTNARRVVTDSQTDRLIAFFTSGQGSLAATALTEDVFVGEPTGRIVGVIDGAARMASSLPADVRRRLAVSLAGWSRRHDDSAPGPDTEGEASAAWPDAVARLYRVVPAGDPSRAGLLAALAESDADAPQAALLDLLVTAPPSDPRYLVQGLSPLVRRRSVAMGKLLPGLLERETEPLVLTVALDLANWLTREGIVPTHPGLDHAGQLGSLLTNTAGRLARIEDDPGSVGQTVGELREAVEQGVALAVGLCDALGQIGDHEQAGKLVRALELGHRRVQTEAAAALARLGDERGRETLVALAAEPVARLRVIQYARELDLLDQIPAEYQTDEAEAISRVAANLADPTRFGLAPTETERLASRMLIWPGEETPVRCDLVRYAYRLPQGTYQNVAFVGREVDAVASDVASLAVDDIYALYAGRSIDHPEIRAIPWEETPPAWQEDFEPLAEELPGRGYSDVQPRLGGRFLGSLVLVAEAVSKAGPSLVLVHQTETGLAVLPHLNGRERNAVRPEDLFHLHVGRALLNHFNPPEGNAPRGAATPDGPEA